MATVNDIKELKPAFHVDNNTVICRAVKNDNDSTVIIMVTPKNAWTKKLVITTSTTFGYKLKCGDNDGHRMQGLNENNKYNMVNLGNVTSGIAIQFVKAKTFGVQTNYGTMSLPNTVAGYTIMFFWPNDSPGDHWNSMINIIDQAHTVTSKVAGIADNVVAIGKDAAALIALFG